MNAYGVAIDLAVGGNAKTEARALTVSFEALEAVLLSVDKLLRNLGGRGKGLATAGAQAATEWNRAAIAIERAGAAAQTVARESRAVHSGFGTLVAGFVGFEALKTTFNAEAKVRQAQTALRVNGFTTEQSARGNRAAIGVQETNTGVTQVQALDILKTLQSITQSPELAIAGLASSAKYAPVFETLGLDLSKAIEAALKGAEFRGELTKKDASGAEVFSQSTVDGFMQTAANMAILSNGKVGPEALLTFLRQSGNAGAFSTREGLAAMLPILQSLNPSQAGTAMQALDQQFSSGKMSDGGYLLGREMGIFSNNPALARKVGMGQRQLLPGAMDPVAQALERTDKTAFILDYLRPRIEAYNRKMYGATYNNGTSAEDDQRRLAMDAATAQQLSSRIPGGKGIGDILRNAPQVARDREAMRERMKGGDPAAIAVAENPEIQVKAFTAAWTAFTAAWGAAIMGPVTEALKAMTSALNAMSDWTRANPGIARFLSEVGTGLVALSAGLYALGKAVGVVQAIAGLAGGTAGTGAMATGGAAAGGALRFLGPIGATIGAYLGITSQLNPLTPDQARKYAPHLAAPNDGYDEQGRPNGTQNFHPSAYLTTPGASPKLAVEGNLVLQDGTNLGRYTMQAITRSLGGAAGSGTTGPDMRVGPWSGMSANI